MITADKFVFFYSGKEIYSNWHRTPSQFTDPNTGFVFENSEQHFMWQKAIFFNDLKIADRVARTPDPATVKLAGRLIKGYNDKAWECVREGMMAYSCYLKFSQNAEWGAQLKATGRRILIEASPVDKIWGVGMDEAQASSHATSALNGQPFDTTLWPGRNLLGKALMTVRGLL